MSTMGLKEKAVLASLGMVALYAIAALVWFLKMDITDKRGEWYQARKKYVEACKTYASECRLISEKRTWVERYDEKKSEMPTFDGGKATDTTWLSKVGEVAKKHHIDISNRNAGKETIVGEVYELEISANWEGALESLVGFMHELENTEEGMFDFKSLNFKPSSKKGYLKGSFVLTCAYMRE